MMSKELAQAKLVIAEILESGTVWEQIKKLTPVQQGIPAKEHVFWREVRLLACAEVETQAERLRRATKTAMRSVAFAPKP